MSWWKSREDSKESYNTWRDSLEDKDLSSHDIKVETNKNYKASTGSSKSELQDRNGNKEARDNMTEDELNRNSRLERKQVENIQDTSSKKETKAELENSRQNKKSWW